MLLPSLLRQLGLRRSLEKSKLAQPTPAPNTPLRRSHGVNRCHWFLSELSGFFVTTTVLVLLGLCPLGAANALGTVSRFLDAECYPSNVRKIRIDSTTGQQIQMFELRALSDGTNVALQGLATQSSTLSTRVATNAIDNKNNTFSHTKDANAFWEVDLDHDYVIQEVYVLNRWCQDLSDPTGCLCRLTNATLTLLNSAGSVLAAKTFGDTCTKSELTESFEAHCPTQSPMKSLTASPSSSPAITCYSNVKKVKLQSTTNKQIQMFELQVISSGGTNVASGKPATQSSTLRSFIASRAVDGVSTTFSHTKDPNAFWEVDLGGLYTVYQVVILNRWCKNPKDPTRCLCRLSQAKLTLLDEFDAIIAERELGNTCNSTTITTLFSNPACAPQCEMAVPQETDVLIIGAGIAGIRAAARIREVAPDLEVTVVEATDRIGGRVNSFVTKDGFILQKGANWLNLDDPAIALYENYVGNSYAEVNEFNMTVYEIMCPDGTGGRSLRNSNGVHKAKHLLERLHNDDTLDQYTRQIVEHHLTRMMKKLAVEVCTAFHVPEAEFTVIASKWTNDIVPCMNQVSLDFFLENIDPEEDMGAIAELVKCGWDEGDPLEFLYKIISYDYEFSSKDGSIFGWFDVAEYSAVFATGDWELSIVSYAQENNIEPEFRTRVNKIEYDLDGDKYKARVTAQLPNDKCMIYEAQRVISTVATGVYNNDLIAFDPPLLYPAAEYNPMKMANFVKIFYKFPEYFWGTGTHYIYPITSGLNSSSAIIWKDLNRAELFPGSNILMLTLLDESFLKAVGEDNVRKQNIPEDVLHTLLDPIRITFPNTFVEPIDVYYNDYHSDPNFGYGAYSNWDIGYSPYDYFHFWGAYERNEYIEPCDHNGCNRNDEWILFLSGAAMCFEQWEYVDGGWLGGEFSANLMMESLGLDIGEWGNNCYPDYDSA